MRVLTFREKLEFLEKKFDPSSHFSVSGCNWGLISNLFKIGQIKHQNDGFTSAFKKYFKVILGHEFRNKVEKGQIFIFFKKVEIQFNMKNSNFLDIRYRKFC